MTQPVRIGVIGLGRRWRKRYRPALRLVTDHFKVCGVYDQLRRRAVSVAKEIGCDAAQGVVELLNRVDLDAVLLLDPQWFGLWPLEVACRAGKPVFCCPGLECDEEHADALLRQVQASALPVLMEFAPRFAAATARCRELLRDQLGPARLLMCESVQPDVMSRGHRPSSRARTASVASSLCDWCSFLLDAEPIGASCLHKETLTSVLLDFADGRAAQINRWRAPAARRTLRLRAVAERGSLRVVLPDRVSWQDDSGRHSDKMTSPRPLGVVLLERFHGVLRGGQAAQPSLADAHRIMGCLRCALAIS